MTPILYASNETNFTSNGIGRLADARRCEVTEERNGQYELVMEYPTNGALLSYIVAGNYIMATHDSSGKPQPFQIYNVSEPLNGFIEVRAWHISYALNAIILKPFTATSCAEAVSLLASKSINTNPFSFWTDKSVSNAFALTVPKSVRAVLGGTEGSLLDVYGKGEYEFDMFTVKLHVNRGVDRGVQIRYGKNLVSLERELDASNIHNAVVPYWTDGETTVSLDHLVVKTGQTAGRAVALDLSDSWDEAPTTSQLETKAQTIIDASESYELKENLKIDFVFLWQTEEYKDIANLERVNLCDTVHIIYTKRGINATAKVIKVVYDALRERYLEMELGEPRTSLYQQIQQDTVQTVAPMIPSRPVIQSAIDKATELISGGFGGYIKYKYLVDGTPSEMLIMDAASEATATNIIRLNQNGIGFSTDGGATYANAWTIDGHLNADFIQTGKISDASGLNFWDLVSGIFQTKQGTIGGFTIDANGLTSGDIDGTSQTGSQISPTGIIFNDAANWRSHMMDRYAIEQKLNGVWTEVVAYALGLVNNYPVARIDVDGGFAALLGRIGNAITTIDGIDYNSAIYGNVQIGNYLYAKKLRIGETEAVSITATPSSNSQISNMTVDAVRMGKLIDISITFTTASTLSSGGTFNFTLSGLPTPAAGAFLRSHVTKGTKVLDLYISADGQTCGVQNLSGSNASADTFQAARIIYLEA
jgi:phage minor structural protein